MHSEVVDRLGGGRLLRDGSLGRFEYEYEYDYDYHYVRD